MNFLRYLSALFGDSQDESLALYEKEQTELLFWAVIEGSKRLNVDKVSFIPYQIKCTYK